MIQEEIYKENILDHYKDPQNKGKLESPNKTNTEHNPLCGDEITVYINIKDKSIQEIRWEGQGCAISQASMSILTDHILGSCTEDIKQMTKEDIIKLLGIKISPGRMKCATLSIKTIQGALEK